MLKALVTIGARHGAPPPLDVWPFRQKLFLSVILARRDVLFKSLLQNKYISRINITIIV